MEPVATLAEAARILRPGGILAAIDCDWPPSVGNARVERGWDDCRRAMRVFESRLAANLPIDRVQADVPFDDPALQGYSGRDPHQRRDMAQGVRAWSKDGHLEQMRASTHFGWCHEVVMHRVEQGDANRFVSLLRSQGDYQMLRRAGLDDDHLGLTRLQQLTATELGAGTRPFVFSYRARIAVRWS